MRHAVLIFGIMTLLPSLILFPLAASGLLTTYSPDLSIWAVLASLWGAGLTAVLVSGWQRPVMVAVGVVYTLAAALALPLLSLSASCTFSRWL